MATGIRRLGVAPAVPPEPAQREARPWPAPGSPAGEQSGLFKMLVRFSLC